jgi:hypothetical protein
VFTDKTHEQLCDELVQDAENATGTKSLELALRIIEQVERARGVERFGRAEARAALRIFGLDRRPVRYLDGAGIPMRYKERRVEGERAPMNVLAEMERHPAKPWKIRDRMLREMGWCPKRRVRLAVKPGKDMKP